MLRRLFEREGVAEQLPLGERRPEERKADRQAEGEAGRHRDVRVAGHGRERRAAVRTVVTVDEVGERRRAARRGDKRVQPILRRHGVDAVRAGPLLAVRQRRLVLRIGERGRLLGLEEDLLAEVRHLAILVPLVERDQVLERVRRRLRAKAREVRVQVRLELVEQDREFAVGELRGGRDVRRIDDDRAERTSTAIASSTIRSACALMPKQALRGMPIRAPSSAFGWRKVV